MQVGQFNGIDHKKIRVTLDYLVKNYTNKLNDNEITINVQERNL